MNGHTNLIVKSSLGALAAVMLTVLTSAALLDSSATHPSYDAAVKFFARAAAYTHQDKSAPEL